MRLNNWMDAAGCSMAEAIAWGVRLVQIGHNAWILPGNGTDLFKVWYEHPRGAIPAPSVGWQLQFHSDSDGFVSPTWSIKFSADCKIPKGLNR